MLLPGETSEHQADHADLNLSFARTRLSHMFCTSLLAAFNRLIATGYTTATIANCKIGAGLRPFGPQSLKPRCEPQPVPRLTESSQPALQTRLTAAKPGHRPSSTATREWRKMALFRRPKRQIIVRLCNLKTSESMVYESSTLRNGALFWRYAPFPRKPRFPPIAEKSH